MKESKPVNDLLHKIEHYFSERGREKEGSNDWRWAMAERFRPYSPYFLEKSYKWVTENCSRNSFYLPGVKELAPMFIEWEQELAKLRSLRSQLIERIEGMTEEQRAQYPRLFVDLAEFDMQIDGYKNNREFSKVKKKKQEEEHRRGSVCASFLTAFLKDEKFKPRAVGDRQLAVGEFAHAFESYYISKAPEIKDDWFVEWAGNLIQSLKRDAKERAKKYE